MSELLNLVGLSMGVLLYSMLLMMVVRAGAASENTPVDPLLVVTSLLGLIWNLCALSVYQLPKVGIDGPFPLLAAVGFGALGFLPAVVVHSVLRGEHDRERRTAKRVVAIGVYTVSGIAASLHFASATAGWPVPSATGMRLLTYAFVAMVVPMAVLTRGQPGSRRALWVAALSIFAVSGLHLSQLHKEGSWPIELLGHHASLPLALAILYQDYPFALADLFLKRALALLAVVSLAFLVIVAFAARSQSFAQFVLVDPRQVGLLVTLWVATALAYPLLRRVTAWFVDTIVLRRPDYQSLRANVMRGLQASDDVSELLNDVCLVLGPALCAKAVTWHEWNPPMQDEPVSPVLVKGNRATVTVPTSDAPRFTIDVAELTQGRRFLSDDVATLDAIAIAVARRIDAIRITQERYDRGIREQEIGKLATEAELRALRAQINPHFLFNALTTIGYLIQTAPARAMETLMQLTVLLRAVLRSEGEFTTLGREIDLIESYLDIERARFEQRLRVTIDVPTHLRAVKVPPLVLQPLVENAVKHGIAPQRFGGHVAIRAIVDASSHDRRQVSITVHDTGTGATSEAFRQGRERGVGLRNVERRLECQYGATASLSIRCSPTTGTTVEVRLPFAVTPPTRADSVRVSA